jgi:hypothetical protein
LLVRLLVLILVIVGAAACGGRAGGRADGGSIDVPGVISVIDYGFDDAGAVPEDAGAEDSQDHP